MPVTPFRQRAKTYSPGFLREGSGERIMYVFGTMMDCRMAKVNQGTKAHLPMVRNPYDRSLVLWVPPADCLAAQGSSLDIDRGLTESDFSYASRLQRALDSYRYAGTARGVLGQILGYLLALTPTVRMVWTRYDRSTVPPLPKESTWASYPAGRDPSAEPVTFQSTVPGNWIWDDLSTISGSLGYWSSYVVLFAVAPNDFAHPGGVWGSGVKWGGGNAWGIDKPASFGRSIALIIKQFKAAHTWARTVIISFDASLFDPAQEPDGIHNPDGYFGRWSKVLSGVRVRSRFSNARYGGEVI